MGSIFSPDMPPPPPPPPQAAIPPTMANSAVQQSGFNQRARAAAALASGTQKTGGQGDLTTPRTTTAGLLGQT